jgi:hypothetical protein
MADAGQEGGRRGIQYSALVGLPSPGRQGRRIREVRRRRKRHTRRLRREVGHPNRWCRRPSLDLFAERVAYRAQVTRAVAVAETGTVVLDHGPGQGRRAITLLPDARVHRSCVPGGAGCRRRPGDVDQRAVGDERHGSRVGRTLHVVLVAD